MNQLDFSGLLGTLNKQNSSKDRAAIIQTTVASNTFTCEQVAQIIEQLSFSKDRLRVLKIIRPRISDLENTFQIIKAFTFAKDQRKASALLGQPEDVEIAFQSRLVDELSQDVDMPPAMELSAFSQLLDTLDNQTFPKEQLYLVELAAFRNTFTSAQAAQILEKFKFPRYQLKALKILNYRITDPQNHFLLLQAFTYSSYKKKVSALLSYSFSEKVDSIAPTEAKIATNPQHCDEIHYFTDAIFS